MGRAETGGSDAAPTRPSERVDFDPARSSPARQAERDRAPATNDGEDQMRRLVLRMSMTLDGYVGGPTGEIDWIMRTLDPDATAWIARFRTRFIFSIGNFRASQINAGAISAQIYHSLSDTFKIGFQCGFPFEYL